jgi:hypothetical protein
VKHCFVCLFVLFVCLFRSLITTLHCIALRLIAGVYWLGDA